MEGSDSEFAQFTVPTLKAFLKACSQSVLNDAPNCIFSMNSRSLVSWKTMQRHFFSALNHLSPVIIAKAAALAILLFHNSRFNFHCYTQREAMPAQKLALKWQLRPFATSCVKDYKGHLFMQTSSCWQKIQIAPFRSVFWYPFLPISM